jgi:hypothetical protein
MNRANSNLNPAEAAPVQATRQAAQQTEQAARRTANHPAIQLLGRVGYAAKGLVYIMIGGLAGLAALGSGGATTDRKGAIQAVYEQPFGEILLGLITFGLACYALWSFIQAIADTEGKGSDLKGLATRLFYAGVGVSYTAFALAAFQLLMGAGNAGKNSDANAKDWTAELLKQPVGVLLVIVAALIVLGAACYQFYKAYKADFHKELELGKMGQTAKDWTVRLGRIGLAARGVVFGIIGLFLIIAALQHNPDQAKGLGGALQELAGQRYGQILLGLVAAGLMAYGVYSLAVARYRRMVETAPTSH